MTVGGEPKGRKTNKPVHRKPYFLIPGEREREEVEGGRNLASLNLQMGSWLSAIEDTQQPQCESSHVPDSSPTVKRKAPSLKYNEVGRLLLFGQDPTVDTEQTAAAHSVETNCKAVTSLKAAASNKM